jgi:predicted HTH domain antitoxin
MLVSGMTIELPDEEVANLQLTPAKIRLELAVGLYAGRRISLGRAAKIAGVAYASFMHEIGQRGLCINYTVEDAEHDMRMADQFSGGPAKG